MASSGVLHPLLELRAPTGRDNPPPAHVKEGGKKRKEIKLLWAQKTSRRVSEAD